MVFIINANEVIKHQQDVQENNGVRFLYKLHYFRATPQNSAYNGTLFQAQKKSNQNNLVLLFVIFVVIFLFVNSLHQISSSPSNPKRLYPNNLKLRVFAEKDSDASTRFSKSHIDYIKKSLFLFPLRDTQAAQGHGACTGCASYRRRRHSPINLTLEIIIQCLLRSWV